MDTRLFWGTKRSGCGKRSEGRWGYFWAAAALLTAVMLPAAASAQAIEAPSPFNQATTVLFTECAMYVCTTTAYSPNEVVKKITAAQRTAIVNRDCKGLRNEYGRNLESFPFEFRDTPIIDCIDDRSIRLWMTQNNYQRFVAHADTVTSVAEYHEYLRSVG